MLSLARKKDSGKTQKEEGEGGGRGGGLGGERLIPSLSLLAHSLRKIKAYFSKKFFPKSSKKQYLNFACFW